MPKPRIFCDFHNGDDNGGIRLNCTGTQQDLLGQNIELYEGLELTLYSEDVEIDGVVRYCNNENLWVAIIDWAELINKRMASFS